MRAEEPWLPPLGPFASLAQRWLLHTTDPELARFLEEALSALRVDDSHEAVSVFRVRPPMETELAASARKAKRSD